MAMAMGRSFRVYHNPAHVGPGNPYSLVLEQKGRGQEDLLLIENYSVTVIDEDEFKLTRTNYTQHSDAHGCLGILRMQDAGGTWYLFLVLVTSCASVGKINSSVDVYRVTGVSVISLRGVPGDEEKAVDVKKLLSSGAFYFSWNTLGGPTNLTLSAQKAARTSELDNRFFWNRLLHVPFVRHGVDVDSWLLRVMCGSVEIKTAYVGSKQAKLAVVSRLSSERAGTRFQVRGVDDDGNVANFVETEQLISVGDDEVSSFVQIRGSVPVFWDQHGINVGSHKIRMSRGYELSSAAFDIHFDRLKQAYGKQAIVNLLGSSSSGSKEGEATLSVAYQNHHRASPQHRDVDHILYDYHNEAKSDKTLSGLLSRARPHLASFGFFSRRAGGGRPQDQTGTVRTNCTDCLDRTNSVQTVLGLELLGAQLASLDLGEVSPSVVFRVSENFKAMWAGNGNELSKIYAGTGVVGTSSKLVDGARSAARTIQNNLLDSSKQEAIDALVAGCYFKSNLANLTKLYFPRYLVNEKVLASFREYTTPEPLRVAVGTYNIAGGKQYRSVSREDLSLANWLIDSYKGQNSPALIDFSYTPQEEERPIDIYAIGFEEIVDLNAKNIANASTENARAWAQELTKVLDRGGSERFTLLKYQQLVGVCLYVFVRPELAPRIKDMAYDSIKTGLGGAAGNKGAVAVRFSYLGSSLAFVCSHFAAGQNNISDRNADFDEAAKKLKFSKGGPLMGHDYVFWCGDFNYRINMGREDVKRLVAEQNWPALLAADQLRLEHDAGRVFGGFVEATVDFAPTYKYDMFSDEYDTSEKQRVPAWTDRVLWRKRDGLKEGLAGCKDVSCRYYGRSELKQSDHRPVLAVLDLDVLRVDVERRQRVLANAIHQAGPPDGSVVLKPLEGGFLQAVADEMGRRFGQIRFIKRLRDFIWVAFIDNTRALAAAEARGVTVANRALSISLKHPEWRTNLETELKLGFINSVSTLGPRGAADVAAGVSLLNLDDGAAAPRPAVPARSAPPPPVRRAPPPPQATNHFYSNSASSSSSSSSSSPIPPVAAAAAAPVFQAPRYDPLAEAQKMWDAPATPTPAPRAGSTSSSASNSPLPPDVAPPSPPPPSAPAPQLPWAAVPPPVPARRTQPPPSSGQ